MVSSSIVPWSVDLIEWRPVRSSSPSAAPGSLAAATGCAGALGTAGVVAAGRCSHAGNSASQPKLIVIASITACNQWICRIVFLMGLLFGRSDDLDELNREKDPP